MRLRLAGEMRDDHRRGEQRQRLETVEMSRVGPRPPAAQARLEHRACGDCREPSAPASGDAGEEIGQKCGDEHAPERDRHGVVSRRVDSASLILAEALPLRSHACIVTLRSASTQAAICEPDLAVGIRTVHRRRSEPCEPCSPSIRKVPSAPSRSGGRHPRTRIACGHPGRGTDRIAASCRTPFR